jgi:hypothetical protein
MESKESYISRKTVEEIHLDVQSTKGVDDPFRAEQTGRLNKVSMVLATLAPMFFCCSPCVTLHSIHVQPDRKSLLSRPT